MLDFVSAFERIYPYGDFFTLNVSSPNTPQLRDLQERNLLKNLVAGIQAKNRELGRGSAGAKPVLVNIAPDMELAQADDIVEVALSEKTSAAL